VESNTSLPSANLRLSGQSQEPIKKLVGFKSFHTVPKDITNATREFVKTCAAAQIEQELEQLWTSLRQEFGYRRKDKRHVSLEKGSGLLALTDFRFQLTAEQDPNDPSCVVWRRAVDEIRDPGLLLAAPFNRTFAQTFDCIEAPFPEPQEVEQVIDRLEGLSGKNILLEYPLDCSRCLVTFVKLGIVIEITSDAYQIKFHSPASPQLLCEKIFAFQRAILTASPENLLVFAKLS
jgi:hypothetical protein